MAKTFIVTGDTTTHGGTIYAGEYAHTVCGKAMVLNGDRFLCPQCGTEAQFIGTSHVRVNGRSRVVMGDRTTCGAMALRRGGKAVSEACS